MQLLVEELAAAFSSTQPIELKDRLVFNSNFIDGASIVINDNGGSSQAIEVVNDSGEHAVFGIGLGNRGLVANELAFDETYAIGPEAIQAELSDTGKAGGEVLVSIINNVVTRTRKFSSPTVTGYGGDLYGSGSGVSGKTERGDNTGVAGGGSGGSVQIIVKQ
jgi:hypothetical protein